MSSSKPTPTPTQAFNDVLAKMMQAEVNEGGPPPATPSDPPVEVISHIHVASHEQSAAETEDAVQKARKEFEKTLKEHLEGLRNEIHEARAKSGTLKEAAKAKWSKAMADVEDKEVAAREKLGELATATGEAWERLRDGAKIAWEDLEEAVRKARSEF